MGSFNIRMRADSRALPELRRKIEAGIKAAGPEIERDVKQRARSRIAERDAIWTYELVTSFDSSTKKAGDRQITEVWNYDPKAEYLERGATFPFKKPPIAALVPWVESKLVNWTLVDDDTKPLGATLAPKRAKT